MIFYDDKCAWKYPVFSSGFSLWRGKLKIISESA